MKDWREAHAWLRGYSDAKAGKPSTPAVAVNDHGAAYERGYAVAGR